MTTVFIDTPIAPEGIDLAYLQQNALWMIMDPWYPHPWPHDVQADPLIDQRSDAMVAKIVDYLPNLKHVKLSCPQRFPVHEKLAHIENFYNETPNVTRGDICVHNYMQEHGLKDIVYTGFHLGRCILKKETGAIQMNKYGYRTWMKRDLVGVLITDDENHMDAQSKNWLLYV